MPSAPRARTLPVVHARAVAGTLLLAVGAIGALSAAGCAARRPAGPLLQPDERALRAAAPDTFAIRFETTRGPFTVQVVRAWAPRGADRAYYLTRSGFYDGTRFFRVLRGFVAQFGANGDPRVSRVWDVRTFADDPVRRQNLRGTVAFATAGPNTRTTQLFVNLRDNVRLDRLGFAPIGRVIEGMAVVDSLYGGYGEGAPQGKGPDQDRLATEGARYLEREFPRLDGVRTARVVREPAAVAAAERGARREARTPAGGRPPAGVRVSRCPRHFLTRTSFISIGPGIIADCTVRAIVSVLPSGATVQRSLMSISFPCICRLLVLVSTTPSHFRTLVYSFPIGPAFFDSLPSVVNVSDVVRSPRAVTVVRVTLSVGSWCSMTTVAFCGGGIIPKLLCEASSSQVPERLGACWARAAAGTAANATTAATAGITERRRLDMGGG